MEASRRRMLIGGIGILLVAQILYGLFTLATVYKSYRASLLSVQSVATEKFGLDLSRLLRFGKNLERMEGLDVWMQRLHAETDLDRLVVRNAAGNDVAVWPEGSTTPAIPKKGTSLKPVRNKVQEFSDKGLIWLTHLLHNRMGEQVGTVFTGIDEDTLTQRIIATASEQGLLFLGIAVMGCALFFVLVLREGKPPFPRLGKGCFIVPLVLSQLVFLVCLRSPVNTFLQHNAHEAAKQLGQHLGQDINHIIGLGLPLNAVPSLQIHLDTIRQTLPWVQSVTARNTGCTIYTSGTPGADITATVPVIMKDGHRVGAIIVGVSDSFVDTVHNEIVLNTLTTMIIALLFMLELVSLQTMRSGMSRQTEKQATLSPFLIRPILFLSMFAIDLPISFIPLRIAEMDLNLFGLPADVVMGLPLSVEMCAVGLGILAGGLWSRKHGWRPLLLWGAVLVTLGNCAGGLVESSLAYILSRGFSGFGYGMINIAGQIFIVAHSSQENRAGCIAAMIAGMYAGFLCGSAFGGLVADTLGYASAFFVSSLCMACIGLFLACLPREPWSVEHASGEKLSLKTIGAFFADKRMSGLLLGNIFPCAFVTVCLFQFFIPVSLSQGGVSPAGIGRVFVLFCLVIIVLGPRIGTIVDASSRKHLWLVAGGVLCIAGIAALALFEGLPAAFLSVAMLALCNAIVSSAQGAYALELPISHEAGSASTISCYNITERVGQMLGPITLGQVMALWGVTAGLWGMVAVFVFLNLAFALMGSSTKGSACRS